MERLGLVVVSPRRPSVGRRPRSCSWLGPWRSFEAVELATLETGGLVQQPAGLGAHWKHSAGRSRGTPLRHAGAISHGGVTRNGLCQTRRRSVGTKYKDTSLVTDAQITQRQLDAFRRFLKLLPHGQDLALVILKGHLLIEEQIKLIINEPCISGYELLSKVVYGLIMRRRDPGVLHLRI